MKVLLPAIGIALLVAPATQARPGTIDRDFGNDGVVAMHFKQRWPEAAAVVVQAGRPVIAVDGQIVRFRRDGRTDPGFASPRVPVADMEVTPAGDLLRVAGETVERLDQNGLPDPAFGPAGDGRVSLPGYDFAALAVAPDGAVVVAGQETASGRIAVARLRPGGTLDPSFGAGGVAVTPVSKGSQASLDRARSVALGSDGKIIVGGSAGEAEAPGCMHCWGPYLHAVVLRYLSDGGLDPSFGQGGVFSGEGEPWGGAQSVLVRPSGGVIFVASQMTGVILAGDGGVGFAVVALAPSGQLDGAFADGGISRSFFTSHYEYSGPEAAAQIATPDGRILVAGGQAFPAGFMVERLRGDGTRTRFGHGRFLRWRIAGRKVAGAGATALALAPGHRFYVLGFAEHRVVLGRSRY